jgi:hypothetical protein
MPEVLIVAISSRQQSEKECILKKFVSIAIMFFIAAGFASAVQVDSLVVTGSISQTFSVTITPSTAAGQLVLTETWETTDLVIAAAEFATNKNHWSIGVYSLNGSKFVGSTGESLAYTFSLGDIAGMQNLILSTALEPIYKSMTGKTPQFLQNMMITYLGDPLLQEGTYSDTIFLIISSD